MQSIFLSSKMTMPKSPKNFIDRRQLDTVLNEHINKKLIVFRAPAGYGKTTLLSTWLQKKEHPIIWISLDELDDNPTRFWSYILTALNKNLPITQYEQLLQLVQTKDSAALKLFVYSLIEELSSLERPIHIVLDDFHFIQQQTIHRMMTIFIDYLPENVHIYMTTRNAIPFPVTKWLVKQWLFELTFEQLQFTRPEIQQFFSQVAHRTLTDRELTTVVKNTEGWVSGLLLTMLSTEHKEIPEQTSAMISDFLWHEIIAQQTAEIQLFLLQTSFLHELNPAICNKLTGLENSEDILRQLTEKGLFTIKLDEEKSTYRYHHLFIATLQKELYKRFNLKETSDFIQRLALLQYEHGNYLDAIQLALNNGDYPLAADWISESIVAITSSGHSEQFLRWIHHLLDVEFPLPNLLLSISFIKSVSLYEIELAKRLMTICESRMHKENWQDDPDKAYYFVNYIQTKAYLLVGIGDRLPEVFALLKSQLHINPTSKQPKGLKMTYHTYETNLLRTSLASRGKLVSVSDVHEVVRFFKETNLNTEESAIYLYSIAATMLYEENALDDAEHLADDVIQESLLLELPNVYIPMYILKAKIYCAKKQFTTAQNMLQPLIQTAPAAYWKNALQTMLADCYLQMNEPKNAAFMLVESMYYPFEQIIYAKSLIQQQAYEEALALLLQTKQTASDESQIATTIEVTILEAIIYDQMNNPTFALHALHQIIPLASQYNYVRSFLDHPAIFSVINHYVETNPYKVDDEDAILQHVHKLQKAHVAEATSTWSLPNLTQREKEIYKLILEGATNKEIAKSLFLSEGTVRVYISALYQKIEVRSRAQAIKKAEAYKELLQQ